MTQTPYKVSFNVEILAKFADPICADQLLEKMNMARSCWAYRKIWNLLQLNLIYCMYSIPSKQGRYGLKKIYVLTEKGKRALSIFTSTFQNGENEE